MGTGFVIVAAALIAAAEVGGADGEPRAPRHWPTDGIPVGGFTSKLSDDPKVMQERIVALQDVGLSYAYVVAHRSSKSLTVSLEVADRLGFALVPHMETARLVWHNAEFGFYLGRLLLGIGSRAPFFITSLGTFGFESRAIASPATC